MDGSRSLGLDPVQQRFPVARVLCGGERAHGLLVVGADVFAEEVELALELVEYLCPFATSHFADDNAVEVLVGTLVPRGLHTGVVVIVDRRTRKLGGDARVVLNAREQDDGDEMLHLHGSPFLEQGGQKAIDNLVEHDLARVIGVKVPHLAGHLDEEHISSRFATEDGLRITAEEGRLDLAAVDIDGGDLGLDCAHEQDHLALVDGPLCQLPDRHPPHVGSREILVFETELDVRCLDGMIVGVDLGFLVCARQATWSQGGVSEHTGVRMT